MDDPEIIALVQETEGLRTELESRWDRERSVRDAISDNYAALKDKLRQKLDGAQDEIIRLEGKIEELQGQIDNLLRANCQMEAELHAHDTARADALNQLEALTQDLESVASKELLAAKETALRETAFAREQLGKAQEEIKRWTERFEMAQSELSRAAAASQELQGKLQAERLAKDQALQNARDLKEELDKAHACLATREVITGAAQLESQRRVTAAALRQVEEANKNLEQANRQIAALEKNEKDLREQMEQLKNAPLPAPPAPGLMAPEDRIGAPFFAKEDAPLLPEAIPLLEPVLDPGWVKVLQVIREPLSSAQARLRQLGALTLPEGPRAILKFAAGSLAQVSDTMRVLADFLDDSGAAAILSAPQAAVDSALSTWEPFFRARGVAVTRKFETDLGQVFLHPESARTAIYQVLRNAYEAMPRGGVLTVRLEKGQDDGGVHAVFSDTGPGLSAQILAQIFIPFVSSKRGHLGLGLSLARRILRRYGGEVEIANAAPKGAAVTMRFSAAATQAPSLSGE